MQRSNALRSRYESAGWASRYAPLVGAPLPLLGRGGDAAVRRIDDERRAPVLDDVRAEVQPEVVVAADVAPGLGPAGRRFPETDVPVDPLLLDRGRLLLRQERVALAILGPLDRRGGAEVLHHSWVPGDSTPVRGFPQVARNRGLILRAAPPLRPERKAFGYPRKRRMPKVSVAVPMTVPIIHRKEPGFEVGDLAREPCIETGDLS